MDAKTVGAVAALTAVSVRTLHHRGYTDADIERLHLVLVYRAVGLPLEEIRSLLDDGDVLERLRRQHQLLLAQADRLQHTIKAVEELMNAHRGGIQLTAEEQAEIFGTTAFSDEYAVEAAERWGETDAWKQSQQRAASFTKQDWIDIKAENDALLEALAQAKRACVAPGSTEADELSARHRASIDRYYDCDEAMHRCLAQMYLADERFTRFYDDVEAGLAQFVHDIVVASYHR